MDLVEELLSLGECGQPFGDELEFFLIERAVRRLLEINTFGWTQMLVLLFEERRDHVPVDLLGLVVAVLQRGFELAFQLLYNIGPDHTFLLEFLSIQGSGIRVFGDGLIEQRLCETGLISFVVTVFAVAEQIDEHIPVVALSVFGRKEHGVDHRFHIVSIHMQNRCKHHFGDVRAIGGGARIEVVRGESDLIVDHDMYGASGLVSVQGFHLHHLIYHALACDRRISMHKDGQHLSGL